MIKRNYFKVALLFGFLFAVSFAMIGFEADCKEIQQSVLRIHILANSDSDEDQQLKLRVRDRLLKDTSTLYEGAESLEEAKSIVSENLDLIKRSAEDEIQKTGYSYPVSVSVGKAMFDTRIYDSFTLPAGEYEALRVVIGDGEGKNWWCVMFPAVCVPVANEQIDISSVLNENGSEIVNNYEGYKFKFKAVELYLELKEKTMALFK